RIAWTPRWGSLAPDRAAAESAPMVVAELPIAVIIRRAASQMRPCAKMNGTAYINPGDHTTLADENLYKAENVGSGTFIIRKPKRKSAKRRQTRLKNPKPGMRK